MPRLARVVMPGSPHHVTQRGNNRQDVFFVDDDRRAYLGFLQSQSTRFGLRLEGYQPVEKGRCLTVAVRRRSAE